MTEPAVTLTDYAIAIECAVLVLLLLRTEAQDRALRFWFGVFFSSIGAAAVLGGTVHGFFPQASSPAQSILWSATLLSILVTSLAALRIAATLQLDARWAAIVHRVAVAQFVLLSLVVLFVTSKFYVAILAYLPSTLFLLFALIAGYRRRPDAGVRWGVTGLVLTVVAAAVQQLKIGLHPVYFDHNALYHVLQGIALWMIFLAARSISLARPPFRRRDDLTT